MQVLTHYAKERRAWWYFVRSDDGCGIVSPAVYATQTEALCAGRIEHSRLVAIADRIEDGRRA